MRAFDAEVAHTGREREVEELGDLWSDLAGVGVDGVAAAQDQVERTVSLQCRCERAGGRERVGACERRIGDEHAVDLDRGLRAPRDRLPQHVVGRRWAEREDRHRSVTHRGRELDCL